MIYVLYADKGGVEVSNLLNNEKYLVVGVVGLVFFIILIKLCKGKNKCTKKTTATVIRLNSCMNTDGKKPQMVYSSVYEYEVDGKRYQKVSRKGNANPKAKIGDTFTLFYNPKDPDEWYVKE